MNVHELGMPPECVKTALLTMSTQHGEGARYCQRETHEFARLHSVSPVGCSDRTTDQAATTSCHTQLVIQRHRPIAEALT